MGAPGDRFEELAEALDRAGIRDRPVAVLDLDAFDANAAGLARRARGVPLRVASKSLRVRRLIDRALAADGFAGILAFTLPEALWLVEHGATDVLVAYPTVDAAALAALASDDRARRAITVMVDETAHLDLIEDATAASLAPGAAIRVAIELDAAYAPLRRLRFGALRSPLARPAEAVALAREIVRRPGLALVGLMAYEGQIAGVGDPSGPYGLAVRAMKALSTREIADRRAQTVAAIRELADLELVNGGGTGSVETTGAEPAVTEIAAGSGLIGPGLFDGYRAFAPRPALHLGFSVVRRPAPRVATLLGGGWIASGAPGADRLPTIAHPAGLAYAPQEGAGEVQTPVVGRAADSLRVGDTVWLRHAKAGEPAEHAREYVLVRRSAGAADGGARESASPIEVVGTAPTYRGEGKLFL